MLSTILPQNETQRLQTLQRYNIMDSEPEKAFDTITDYAAHYFNVPIALISLVGQHRVWFKSRYGMDNKCETTRDIAFCSYTVLYQKLMVINDAELDPRFADNPLVTSAPHVRFYAGMPLFSSDNYAIGTLCLLDTKPRPVFSESENDKLQRLALVVATRLELRLNTIRLFALNQDYHAHKKVNEAQSNIY